MIFGLFWTACKKEVDPRVPPEVSFIEGSNYLSYDTTAAPLDSFLVGVKVVKTEDPLKSLNVSVARNGASETETFYNEVIEGAEQGGFERSLHIQCGVETGDEKWIFSVVDRDGNITQKEFHITVK